MIKLRHHDQGFYRAVFGNYIYFEIEIINIRLQVGFERSQAFISHCEIYSREKAFTIRSSKLAQGVNETVMPGKAACKSSNDTCPISGLGRHNIF